MGMIEEVTTYLGTALSFTPGIQIFANVLPDNSSTNAVMVGVYEAPGYAPSRTYAASPVAWENPRVDVVVRSTRGDGGVPSSTNARKYAFRAWRALESVVNTNLPTSTGTHSYYLRIEAEQSPYLMERDGQGRYIFGFSASVSRVIGSTSG